MQATGIQLAKRSARDAADIVAATQGEGAPHQHLTFLLGEEMFAISILSIREIIEYGSLTRVPMAPHFIRGVINLRGAVVPVLDLALRFGREPRAASKRTCIVIVSIKAGEGNQLMGIVVDSVSEVLEIPQGDIEPPSEFGARIRNDFIQGMGKIEGKFVVILDVNQILSLDEVTVIACMGQTEKSQGA